MERLNAALQSFKLNEWEENYSCCFFFYISALFPFSCFFTSSHLLSGFKKLLSWIPPALPPPHPPCYAQAESFAVMQDASLWLGYFTARLATESAPMLPHSVTVSDWRNGFWDVYYLPCQRLPCASKHKNVWSRWGSLLGEVDVFVFIHATLWWKHWWRGCTLFNSSQYGYN